MKHHKYAKTIIKSIFILIIPLFLLALTTTSTEKNIKAEDDEVVVTPKFKPTSDPEKFLGIWTSGGYNLQPLPDYYTIVGEPVTIRTNTKRSIYSSISGAFDSVHFRWWKSTDGKKWTEVDKNDNGQRKNFTVTPTQPGTTWYQLDTQYYKMITWYLKTHYYSKVTAVHALPEPVNAIKLDVTVDDDYLYNTKDELSNTTYAHATPTPANSTGKITWSVDDPTLATVDEDGEVTANKNGISGTVTVIATMTNNDGSTISGHETVEIGGGLDDQVVKSGTSATYTLKGNTGGGGNDEGDTGKITIDWYKYAPGATKGDLVATGDSPTYVTNKTSMNDDESYYQAKITMSSKATQTITSNKAKLTVIPAGEPDIEIDNTLQNDTYTDPDDTDKVLNKVVNGDSITYKNTLTNQSSEGPLQDGSYVIPLHQKTKVNSVTVDGSELSSDKYSIIDDDATDTDDLVIDFGDIEMNGTRNIEVNTTVQNVSDKESLTFKPYVYGTDDGGNVYRKEADAETINYISNQIEPKIEDINFGAITPYSHGILKYRPDEVNRPNDIVTVTDNRRDKHGVNVYVSQENEFLHTDTQQALPVSLRYYQNGSYQDIFNNKTLITQSESGTNLDSIGWDKKDGLLLYVNNGQLLTGLYSTTLTWNFENSI